MKLQVAPSMETKSTKLDLLNGIFTQSDSAHIISALIDEKINFHKIQKWQMWESNHSFNSENIDSRIHELQNQKEEVKQWLRNLNSKSCTIKIEGTIYLSIED
ncbi:hypothetical protein ACW6QP_05355 [Salegentibacter sp. HM20]